MGNNITIADVAETLGVDNRKPGNIWQGKNQ